MKKTKNTKKVAFVNLSKKGNEFFKIGKKTYVVMDRPKDEIGNNGNFATKILIEIL